MGRISLLSEDPNNLQVSADNLNNIFSTFGPHFTPKKCKTLLQDWIGSDPNVVLVEEELDQVDKFNRLGNCILPDGHVSNDTPSHREISLVIHQY